MSRNRKKKKLVAFLINLIRHDFGFYNPIWKWNLLPTEIRDNYELLEEKLNEWQQKGHIRVFIENGERMLEIISVPES